MVRIASIVGRLQQLLLAPLLQAVALEIRLRHKFVPAATRPSHCRHPLGAYSLAVCHLPRKAASVAAHADHVAVDRLDSAAAAAAQPVLVSMPSLASHLVHF